MESVAAGRASAPKKGNAAWSSSTIAPSSIPDAGFPPDDFLRTVRLAGVELDHEGLIDLDRNLLARRNVQQPARAALHVHLDVGHVGRPGLQRGGYDGQVAGPLGHGDVLAGLDQVGRNVHLAAVHLDVPVGHQLAGARQRRGEAHAVDQVVQPRLQHLQGDFTRAAPGARRLLEGVAQVRLRDAVNGANLLLLQQLAAILRHPAPRRLAVLAGRVGTLERRALGRAAYRFADAPANAVLRSGLSCHATSILQQKWSPAALATYGVSLPIRYTFVQHRSSIFPSRRRLAL